MNLHGGMSDSHMSADGALASIGTQKCDCSGYTPYLIPPLPSSEMNKHMPCVHVFKEKNVRDYYSDHMLY